jgi:hypothetical protein
LLPLDDTKLISLYRDYFVEMDVDGNGSVSRTGTHIFLPAHWLSFHLHRVQKELSSKETTYIAIGEVGRCIALILQCLDNFRKESTLDLWGEAFFSIVDQDESDEISFNEILQVVML